jgi:hypothetical protein
LFADEKKAKSWAIAGALKTSITELQDGERAQREREVDIHTTTTTTTTTTATTTALNNKRVNAHCCWKESDNLL